MDLLVDILGYDAESIDVPIEFRVDPFLFDKYKLYGDRRHPLEVTKTVREAVFRRDRFVCRCCGFRSEKFQQVLHLGTNPRDLEEMFTVCVFCHQCFYVDRVPLMKSGMLLWLPEVDQVVLHHIARDLFMAKIKSGPKGRHAQNLWEKLIGQASGRREKIEAIFGMDPLTAFIQRLQSARQGSADPELKELLKSVRLMPLDRRLQSEAGLYFNQFPQILAYWRSKGGPFGGDPQFKWLDYLEREVLKVDAPLSPESAPEPTPIFMLAAKLLRDTATFFQNVARDNTKVRKEMEGNAATYSHCANLVETDPVKEVPSEEGNEDHSPRTHAMLAVALLNSAADFFHSVAEENPPIREQMLENERVFKAIAERLRDNPFGHL